MEADTLAYLGVLVVLLSFVGIALFSRLVVSLICCLCSVVLPLVVSLFVGRVWVLALSLVKCWWALVSFHWRWSSWTALS